MPFHGTIASMHNEHLLGTEMLGDTPIDLFAKLEEYEGNIDIGILINFNDTLLLTIFADIVEGKDTLSGDANRLEMIICGKVIHAEMIGDYSITVPRYISNQTRIFGDAAPKSVSFYRI